MTILARTTTVLLLAAATPAVAGWLVTHEGEAIQTQGDWEVDGSLIVFTSVDGRLSSMRASEVDLEASRTRSAAPATAPAAAPVQQAAAEPVLVLTDADVGHIRDLTPSASRDEASGEGGDSAADARREPASASRLEIVSWRERLDVESNTLHVSGTVANRGAGIATSARVEVRLIDDAGETIGSRTARLQAPVVEPGAVVGFSTSFAGSPGYSRIDFDVASRGFKLRDAATEPEADEPDV